MRVELRVARVRNRLTQKQLAQQLNVTQQTIAKWETGQHTPYNMAQIRRLSDLLGEPAAKLFPDVML